MTATPRTLIADDQPHVIEALRLLLKNEGFQTDAAPSPAALLDKLKSGEYDVLLMDLNYTRDTTSGEEGLNLLERIRAIDQTLPVIAMTAWGTVELAVEAMQRGVCDFVLKPWENSRLVGTLRNQVEKGRRRRDELRLQQEESEDAQAVGQALLPQRIPEIPGFQIAAASQPLRTLSGDYFDVLEPSPNKLALSIADVTGKGVPAALLMSNVQATVRALASEPPRDLTSKLNTSLLRNSARGKFVTFFHCQIDTADRTLTYTNAGHCAPILLRANGNVERLEADGAVLGVFPQWTFQQSAVRLCAGDRLVLFTDGIGEASNARDEEFGEERLVELIRALRDRGAHELKDRILQAVTTFTGGRAQDDATLVVVAVESPRIS
ncbi:MAG TPA: SpoIIE family protein phosphatase [Bryobacteraceae bacterium]|jgi:sigma-B regulation protein RsbU (phosphoserine phosphatase)